ncbi:hypothetical protein POH93_14405 [Phytobacter diazotrophicus]|uniref:hypothetical protein n=1 Tax=Phytobacter diazotrophicus TaxID=395631 RepID=UPI0020BE46C2|nr:hypothetical protein [Phytobacter diazotrophicus]MCL5502153.1 hypothetical protein [Escherichia coli]MDC0726576.1 hypothetical protein [Phytobacter diazotrophicus]MDC0733869.1 hypothetical protein [Phytobacter diazotrophicus]MDU7134871.1 hypothetical protein [Enterobacteriaceae bacterium]
MKKVLVFFNAQPVEVVETLKAVTTIQRICPDGKKAHLRIMQAGIHSVTGDHIAIYVAANREISSEEIVRAAQKFL